MEAANKSRMWKPDLSKFKMIKRHNYSLKTITHIIFVHCVRGQTISPADDLKEYLFFFQL